VSDEKISAMPSAGALSGTDIFPIVRGGSNYSATASAAAAFAGGTLIVPAPVDTRTTPQTYTLPAGVSGVIYIVYDQYQNALINAITIHNSITPAPTINMDGGSIAFFWTGTTWFPF
jgi:hypothetical protein